MSGSTVFPVEHQPLLFSLGVYMVLGVYMGSCFQVTLLPHEFTKNWALGIEHRMGEAFGQRSGLRRPGASRALVPSSFWSGHCYLSILFVEVLDLNSSACTFSLRLLYFNNTHIPLVWGHVLLLWLCAIRASVWAGFTIVNNGKQLRMALFK